MNDVPRYFQRCIVFSLLAVCHSCALGRITGKKNTSFGRVQQF